jgi:CHRD domain
MNYFSILKKASLAAALAFASWNAHATITIFTAALSGTGEPVPTSTARGAALFSFNDANYSLTVQMSYSNLANNAPFSHIHCCTSVVGTGSAPVALNLTGLPVSATGSYIKTFTLNAASFNSLLNNATTGNEYLNIHTPGTYAAGEIRGFLTPYAVLASTTGTLTAFSTLLSSTVEPVPSSSATGTAISVFDDSNNSVVTMSTYSGLANNGGFGHLHCCTSAPGSGSGPVAVSFNNFPSAIEGSFASVTNLTATQYSALLAGTTSGRAYANIHTPGTYSAGEIRGFLDLYSITTPVPEANQVSMILAGLALLSFRARKARGSAKKACC